MKKLSSVVEKTKEQIAAILVSGVIDRAVKTGVKIVGNGLKVGGAVALGTGALAACESTPAASNFVIYNGTIVSEKQWVNSAANNSIHTLYTVETNYNGRIVYKNLSVNDSFKATNPEMRVGANVSFKESDYNRAKDWIGQLYIISINGRAIQH